MSTATVSRVFNNSEKVSQKTVDKVLEAAKKLDYSPNRVARWLRVNKNESLVIGIVIPDLQNPFFSENARGVEDVAYENKKCGNDLQYR